MFHSARYDLTAVHFLLCRLPEMEPAGTIRCVPRPSADGYQIYKLTRLAVKAQYRSLRLGKRLVDTLASWALNDSEGKPLRIIAHSQIQAIPFYEKCGFLPRGEIFEEDGAPHRLLTLTLLP
jgi:predicted GNAT family N-acyltransferase